MKNNSKDIRKYTLISVIGNLILTIIKLIIAFKTNSMALFGDGIDSAGDVLTSVVLFTVTFIIAKPPDENHPWGHQKAEISASLILSFVMIYISFDFLIDIIKKLFLNREQEIVLTYALIASVISVFGKILLMLNQLHGSKVTNSSMLKDNALNMKNDILISLSVMISVLIINFTSYKILDLIIALFISFYIIYSSLKMFYDIQIEHVMDGLIDTELYNHIVNIINNYDNIYNLHKLRIRKFVNHFIIDFHIEVDSHITIKKAHDITLILEKDIRYNIENVIDITIHLEPKGEGFLGE